jgi:hypothetical protein
MTISKRFSLLAATLALATLPLGAGVVRADDPLPAGYIRVEAPFAQRLVLKIKAEHPEITKIGLHATPPSSNDNAIIAIDIPSKIGKKSSPPDMQKLAMNKPIAARIDKDAIYDLLIPISDAKGRDIGSGFVVMEVPLTKAASEAEALKIGIAIRDEMQRQIPGKDALYQR